MGSDARHDSTVNGRAATGIGAGEMPLAQRGRADAAVRPLALTWLRQVCGVVGAWGVGLSLGLRVAVSY